MSAPIEVDPNFRAQQTDRRLARIETLLTEIRDLLARLADDHSTQLTKNSNFLKIFEFDRASGEVAS